MRMRNVLILATAYLLFGVSTNNSFAYDVRESEKSGIKDSIRRKIEKDVQPLPETARHLETFRGFNSGSTVAEIIKKTGMPDAEVGSGIFILEYHLLDGSRVQVGTPDLEKLLYIDVVTKQGQRTRLLPQAN